ncbi:MAG: Fic family protein [Phycisphaerae bacterium]|nr:Fic family protein [Phycisphaerae bacterium]
MKDKHPSRYKTQEGSEAQTEPGSRGRVLLNRLGIRSKSRMDRVEYEALLAAQTAYLGQITPQTRFTAKLICRMHKDWLGGIYEWAGKYRTVELTKGEFRWPPAYRIHANVMALEKGSLAQYTPCRPGSLPEVARRMAKVHAELLLIHPFRDGNGRLTRWLADLMALQAGLPAPTYGFTGRGSKARRDHYLEAVKKGYLRSYDALVGVFLEAFERRFRETEAGR